MTIVQIRFQGCRAGPEEIKWENVIILITSLLLPCEEKMEEGPVGEQPQGSPEVKGATQR